MKTLKRLTLTKKVIALVILINIAATLTVIPVIFYTIKGGFKGQQRAYLQGIKNLVQSIMEDNTRAIKNYAILFSRDRQLMDNLYYHTELAGERTHPLRVIKQIANTFNIDFIELTDRNGMVVANSRYPGVFYVSRLGNPLIRQALQGKVLTGVEREGDLYVIRAVSPVYYDQGQLIGTITTGITMDRAFLSRIEALSGVKIGILDRNGRVLLPPIKGAKPPELLTADDSIKIEGTRYTLMKLPFYDEEGSLLGEFLIMKEDRLKDIMKKAHIRVAVLLGLIALVSVSVTVYMLRRVLMPVKSLKEGAQRIGEGDFSYRLKVTSHDEIGSLSEVFNRMAENLQKLKDVQERLQHSERLASIGRFTAGIAHELNNPIANIIGLLKLIDREIEEKSPVKEDIRIVLSEAGRCGNIVRDLLVYTRQSPPRKEPTDLEQLIEGIASVVKQGLNGKAVSINFSCAEPLSPVMVDPVQMEQVVRNLLLNAVQSIEGKGRVDIGLSRKDDEVVLTVTDTGCGIKAQDRERIFYPFFSTKKNGQGTGLGLTVCYSIVENHGGRIEVESTEGAGSTFRVILPIIPPTRWK